MDSHVRTAEQEAVLRSIQKLIDFWDISTDELASDGPEPVHAVALPEVPIAPTHKYRHPVTGNEWNGQGSQPQWLRDALTKEGYTVEELKRMAAQAGTES